MRIFILMIIVSFLMHACDKPIPKEEMVKENETASFEMPPEKVVKAIKEKFPGAVPYKAGIDSLLEQLKQYDIPVNKMLWGQSICVDDIINTKDKLKPGIKGPFNLGGLAGLPFTGITGIDAFAHHLPEDGTAILFVGPHIGYNEKDGWGKILRHDQHKTSSCCGALTAALVKLQKDKLKFKVPSSEDYQEDIIEQLAYSNRKDILSSSEPLISFTRLTYREAFSQMADYASKVRERHFRYAVIAGGIIINTDYMYSDYLYIENISILDIHKNEWVKGGKFED
jgi:hypothetical protein